MARGDGHAGAMLVLHQQYFQLLGLPVSAVLREVKSRTQATAAATMAAVDLLVRNEARLMGVDGGLHRKLKTMPPYQLGGGEGGELEAMVSCAADALAASTASEFKQQTERLHQQLLLASMPAPAAAPPPVEQDEAAAEADRIDAMPQPPGGVEGFICPECLLGYSDADQLVRLAAAPTVHCVARVFN
jgi:hypothetical protein